MKKYLLSLSIIGLSFIGISYGYTFECNNFDNSISTNCTPATISYEELNNGTHTINGNPNAAYNITYLNSDSERITFNCTNNICTYGINFDPEDLFEYDFNFRGVATCTEPGNDDIPSNDFCNQKGGGNEGGNEGGGETGGNEGGNEGGLIAGGINAFSGIIERLGSIFGEFGPYILYIAIACLGISLLFKALKSLLGFTNNKAKNSIGGREGNGKIQGKTRLKYATMKQRRTRRRRNRRFKRGVFKLKEKRKNNNNNNQMKFGSRGYNSRR